MFKRLPGMGGIPGQRQKNRHGGEAGASPSCSPSVSGEDRAYRDEPQYADDQQTDRHMNGIPPRRPSRLGVVGPSTVFLTHEREERKNSFMFEANVCVCLDYLLKRGLPPWKTASQEAVHDCGVSVS